MNQEQQITENILNIIKDHLQLDRINLSDNIYDIGMDDFDFVEIIILIEKDYDKNISEDWLFPLYSSTVEELINWIIQQVK